MFYVYALKDPRCQTTFYVGKGSGRRAWSHIAGALSGKADNARKAERIRSIVDAGMHPVVEKVAEYECEADAYEHERELIASLAGLTNIRAGHGWRITKEEAARRAAVRADRIARRDHERIIGKLRDFLAMWKTWPDVVFYGIKNGVEEARQFVKDVQAIVEQFDAAPNKKMGDNGQMLTENGR